MITIDRARYESEDGRGADVTARVRAMVRGGELEIPATNAAFGDPIPNVVKHLVVEYRLDGKPTERTAPENGTVELAAQTGGLDPKTFDARRLPDGTVEITAYRAGRFAAEDANGKRQILTIPAPLPPLPVQGPWRVAFPPKLGAPPAATFDRLISWPTHPDPGVKYFSGSATYRKAFTLPAAYAKAPALRLDLGEVREFATVTLNGKEVAVLWKPPFALDVTPYVHPGVNRLKVKVTNLWPNRIIGDERLPPDVEWDGDHLKRWPDWLLRGKPRPKTGRVTFETWRYYTKDSPLLPSGLLGPVTLQAARRAVVGP